jgi:putative transposase
MTIPKDLLDALMKDYMNPEDLIGETGPLKQLTKQMLERAMQAEMPKHLGYEKNATADKKTTNSRNGSYPKRIKDEFGNLDIEVPRDRDASFEPIILPNGQSRFTGFDDKIIALYAREMTTRDIQPIRKRCTALKFHRRWSLKSPRPFRMKSPSGRIGPWKKLTHRLS